MALLERKLTPLQRQTKREMREGARQSKRHAAAERAELRAAKKLGLELHEYRERKYKQKAKRQKGSPPVHAMPVVETGPVNLPWQHRRDIAIADAKLRGDWDARVLRFARLQESLYAGIEAINEIFKEIC